MVSYVRQNTGLVITATIYVACLIWETATPAGWQFLAWYFGKFLGLFNLETFWDSLAWVFVFFGLGVTFIFTLMPLQFRLMFWSLDKKEN